MGYRLRKDGGGLSRLPIRLRLTAAFALAMSLVLTGAGLFVYLRLKATSTRASPRPADARDRGPKAARGCASPLRARWAAGRGGLRGRC